MRKFIYFAAICLSLAAVDASATAGKVCGTITVGGFSGPGPRGSVSRAIPFITLADGRSYEVGLDPEEPDLDTFNKERDVVMQLVGMKNQALCLNAREVDESNDARPGFIAADGIL